MTITADELARVRYWVASSWEPTASFDDIAVGDVWDREANTDTTTTTEEAEAQSLANVFRIAYSLTQTMISGLVGGVDSFSIGGEYSESRGAAINLLLNRLNDLKAKLDAAIAASMGTNRVLVYQVVRTNYNGR